MVGTGPTQTNTPSTEEELFRSIGALVADAGLSPPLVLKQLRVDLRATPNARRALTNFHRFLMTGFPSAWLRDFQEHHLLQQILLELFSQSQFLADILVRNPELFRWLTSSDVLKMTKTIDEYRPEALDAIQLFQRSERKLDSLKRFQRRELLRIGARQILKEADVATTSAELSHLADAIIGSVADMAYDHIAESVPGDMGRELAVIGLGKLGGGELNFSSDIDLMFVYEKDGPLGGSHGRIATLHEYYCRVSEFVVRCLTEHTGEGHLYRVDMRLRPDGFSGPLAMSRAAYFAYYEARGELWERQMLIKSRVLAGNTQVGEGWRNDIQPFVYPKTMLSSPLEEIAKIKSKIESAVDDAQNIKLGSGGIRDIEFIAQALQLLNGGNNTVVRQRNTLLALDQLIQARILAEKEGRALEAAYRFLRTIEDRLQLLHGLQRHSIPESADEHRTLARQLGYITASAFSRELKSHQTKIRSLFRSVFGIQDRRDKGVRASENESLPDLKAFKKLGVANETVAIGRLRGIMKDVAELADADRFRSFLRMARSHGSPDWCLENLSTLTSSAPIKRTLQQALTSDKTMQMIVLLCSRSSRYTRMLAHEPLLFETLIGRPEDLLAGGKAWSFLKGSDLLRYRLYNEFRSVLRFLVGETSAPQFTRELSSLADEIVRDCFRQARSETPHRLDVPVALIALGKFGGEEISIGSDLDLVLLYRGKGEPGSAKTANTLGRRFRELIDQVYSIDFRLRPEGKNSPLATDFDYYKEYLVKRASLWERQSLSKARSVEADESFGREVSAHIVQSAYQTPLPKSWKKEISEMRKRMIAERSSRGDGVDLKVGTGGLIDLEFLIQAAQLGHGGSSPGVIKPNSFEAIESLKVHKVIKSADAAKVSRNLEFLRRLEACIRMNSEKADFVLPTARENLQAVASAMGELSVKSLEDRLKKVRKENRVLFTATLKSLPA